MDDRGGSPAQERLAASKGLLQLPNQEKSSGSNGPGAPASTARARVDTEGTAQARRVSLGEIKLGHVALLRKSFHNDAHGAEADAEEDADSDDDFEVQPDQPIASEEAERAFAKRIASEEAERAFAERMSTVSSGASRFAVQTASSASDPLNAKDSEFGADRNFPSTTSEQTRGVHFRDERQSGDGTSSHDVSSYIQFMREDSMAMSEFGTMKDTPSTGGRASTGSHMLELPTTWRDSLRYDVSPAASCELTTSMRSCEGRRGSRASGPARAAVPGDFSKISSLQSYGLNRNHTHEDVEHEASTYRWQTHFEKMRLVQDLKQKSVVFSRRRRMRVFVFSVYWQVLVSLTVITDVVIALLQLGLFQKTGGEWKHLGAYLLWECFVTPVIATDVTMRIKVYGSHKFFRRPHCIFDLLLAVTCTVNLVLIFVAKYNEYCNACQRGLFNLVVVRLLPIVRMLWLFGIAGSGGGLQRCPCLKGIRNAVSGNKRRFVDLVDNFDLDLTYVTPTIIAMSVPVQGLSGVYRNVLSEVARFFETHHAGRYLIVNCCPELPYPAEAFRTGQVVYFDIHDHSPPSMKQFVEFTTLVWDWMSRDDRNIVAVHCKGGKGRTGSFVGAWLLYSEDCSDVDDALLTFALARTDVAKGSSLQGVETPSQVRYLKQFFSLLEAQNAFAGRPLAPPVDREVRLNMLSFRTVWKEAPPPDLLIAVHAFGGRDGRGGCSPVNLWSQPFNAEQPDVELGQALAKGDVRISIFDRVALEKARAKAGGQAFLGDDLTAQNRGRLSDTPLVGKGANLSRTLAGKEPGCLFYFVFHTAYLDESGQLAVSIGNQGGTGGMDKAWKKPGKYRAGGEVLLTYTFPTEASEPNEP